MVENILLFSILVIAIFASIAAWINTQIIVRDLAKIKAALGIKDLKKPSFLDKDLDND